MKKLLCVFAAVAAAGYLGLLPFDAHDVADIIPAQTCFIMKDGTQYVVDVGAGVKAVGDTLKKALDALQEQTAGSVFFGTCEQVVLAGDTETLLADIAREDAFRPAAKVYTADAPLDIDGVSAYLHSHPGGVTVSDARAAAAEGTQISVPKILPTDGGYRTVA